jgi:hypothetical protein
VIPGYSYGSYEQSDFTAIGPSERITVVMNFYKDSGGNTPGATFGFAVSGYYYTASGLKNVSIGFPAIKPVVTP